jgi:hypothetical protein
MNYVHRKPISVVTYNFGKWGAITKDKCFFIQVIFEETMEIINGQHNWLVKLDEQESQTDADIVHYCLLLPKLTSTGLPKTVHAPKYCIIESHWMDALPDRNGQPCFVQGTLR